MFTESNLTTNWQKVTFRFRTPVIAKFLTVFIESSSNLKIYFDDFRLVCPPQFDLGADTMVCEFVPRRLVPPDYYSTYEWSTGETSKSITTTQSGVYSLKATLNECRITDSIEIKLIPNCKCEAFVPNVFSPEGVGLNAKWRPILSCIPKQYLCKVYDRFGNLVFRSRDVNESWDGTLHGNQLNPGVYLASVEYLSEEINGVLQTLRVDVTIVR